MKTTTLILASALAFAANSALAQNASSKETTTKSETSSVAAQHKHSIVTPTDLKWTDAGPSLPPGAQSAVLEGDPKKPGLFTIRFKTPAGYQVPPHWHPADEHVTIISGTLYMGPGDTLDTSKATAIPAGGFSLMPAKMHHFAYSNEETIIQVHGMGPWAITYINPSDDPRKKAEKK
jgi:quercetin dioxygenase-like cupin family protein